MPVAMKTYLAYGGTVGKVGGKGADLSYIASAQSCEPLDGTRHGPWSSMVAAWWATLLGGGKD